MKNRIIEGLNKLVLEPAIYGGLAYIATDDAYELMSKIHEPVQRLSENGIDYMQGLTGILCASIMMGYGASKMARTAMVENLESEGEDIPADSL